MPTSTNRRAGESEKSQSGLGHRRDADAAQFGRGIHRGVCAIFPALAEKNDAALIPFLLEGVGDQPALNLPDGNHPNVEGHQIVAETVWTTLGPVLEELRR